MLAIVFLSIGMRRECGPVVNFERHARQDLRSRRRETASASKRSTMWSGVTSLVILVAGVFLGLFLDGGGLGKPWGVSSMIDVLGQARADVVFLTVTAFVSVVVIVLTRFYLPEVNRDPVHGRAMMKKSPQKRREPFLSSALVTESMWYFR